MLVDARRVAATDADHARLDQQIVAAYHGQLADGLSAEWLELPREAARRDALDAATRLAARVRDTDPGRSLELLELARGFDPYNEPLYRQIMLIQHRLGRTDAIGRTLAMLTTRLTELDEIPDLHTIALADRLRRPASAGASSPEAGPVRPPEGLRRAAGTRAATP